MMKEQTTAPVDTPVMSVLRGLRNMVEELAKEITVLAERLDPVLSSVEDRKAEPCGPGELSPPCGTSELVNEMAKLKHHIHHLSLKINSLSNRLEV